VNRRLRDDDAGAALIMAVIVMVVLTSLSLAVLGRTLSVMTGVRAGQDYDGALAAADAGLADALFKIDQEARPSWQAESAAGASLKFKYWAQKNSDSEYVVTSIGFKGKAKHALQARVNRTAQFPYALFSRAPLTLDGTASAGSNKIAFSMYAGTGNVRVGSNSTVVCNGGLPYNVVVDWYAAQSECAGGAGVNKLETPRDLTIKEPPPPTASSGVNWENCPASGVFGAASTVVNIAGTPTTVPTSITNPVFISGSAGPYVCRRNVTFVGTMVPNPTEPEVKIYVLPRTNADGSKTNYSVDMSTALINPVPNVVGLTGQSATRFQLYKVGAEPLLHNPVDDLSFRGVLFAPDTPITINGGNVQWAGSITMGQMVVNGTPNLKILYDNDLATYLGPDWRVSRYREISSAGAVPTWGTL
jgi:hypothetical protein